MKNTSKIVVCGCHETGYETVRMLLESGLRVDWFVNITPEKATDQQVQGYKSFEDLAEKFGGQTYYAEKYSLKSERDIAFFESNQFDLLIQGGWQRLFPEAILQNLRIGAIGVHGSSEFLPKGRGRSPINWSIIEGKKRFILHFFLIKPGIDDGDVFHYEMFDINEWDDCKTLYFKASIITNKAILGFIPKLLASDFRTFKQQGEPTFYPKRTAEDGKIDWSKTVFQLHDFIRALTKPYPGAFCFVGDKKIMIWKAQPFDTRIDFFEAAEGQIIEKFSSGELAVQCRSGLLLIVDYDSEIELKKGMILS